MATSARWSSVVTSRPCPGQSATPMLASSSTAIPAQRERAPQRVVQPARQLGGRAAVGQVAEHDGELVAAQPSKRVAMAQRPAEALGDDLEQLVAVVVAERVVDLLEAVEV